MYNAELCIDADIFEQYINGSFVKTICQARNKNHLLKAKTIATELGLIEGVDFGEINDKCLTELTPENEDGTTLVGIWFKPLPDEVAHKISKKYHLYLLYTLCFQDFQIRGKKQQKYCPFGRNFCQRPYRD